MGLYLLSKYTKILKYQYEIVIECRAVQNFDKTIYFIYFAKNF